MRKFAALIIQGGVAASLFSLPVAAGPHGVNFALTNGPASGGMGGVGWVRPQDPFASIFGNPATLTQMKGDTDFQFGASYYTLNPGLSHDGSSGFFPAFDAETEFNNFINPMVAYRHRVNDKFVLGGGLTVISGLASDMRNAPLSPQVQYLLFGNNISASYQVTEKLSVGATAQLTFGLLDFGLVSNSSVTEEISFRGSVGLTYDLGPVMVGASYFSEVDQTFEEVTATDVRADGSLIFSDLALDQPQEVHLGIATTDKWSEAWLIELNALWYDYSGADGFRGIWNDQYILQSGVQYSTGKWQFRGGYNYHFDFRKENVSTVTSVGGLSQLVGPFGPGAAPAAAPVNEFLIQYVQSTISQPYWNHQVSSGVGYRFTNRLKLDTSVTLGFGSNREIGIFQLRDNWVFHAQAGLTWSF